MLFLLLFALAEWRGESHGIDRLANWLLAAATLASYWQLRRGQFRPAVALLLVALTGSMTLAFVGTGMAAQDAAIRYVVLPQLLAGLALGGVALWSVTGVLALGIVAATAVDLAAAPGALFAAAGGDRPLLTATQALLYLLVCALVIDRMGNVLRQHLDLALARQRELERAHGELDHRRREVEELCRQLDLSYEETLRALTAALDLRDRETRGHSARVVGYSRLLGEALGLDATELRELRRGALLHDIGKIAVPDEILRKPAALSAEEWEIVRRHPEQGFEMLREVSALGGALDVVLRHHERWDGGGYPGRLAGEAIPRLARIFSVVDTFDAMSSDRPYRRAVADREVREELARVAGRQLDPGAVAAFLALPATQLEEVRRLSPGSGSGSSRAPGEPSAL